MKTIEGACGIKATVLAHSVMWSGQELVTFEVEYPRIILAELNTHKMLSKSSHSSRAIPFTKMVHQLTGRPVRFGAANPGMQDKGEEHEAWVDVSLLGPEFGMEYTAAEAWGLAKASAINYSQAFYEAGFHKQVYNRLTEPFQMMRTIITGTEWANFYWLRNHGAADPTLHELARVMLAAKEASTPQMLYPGEWHLPYVRTRREWLHGVIADMHYSIDLNGGEGYIEGQPLSVQDAIKVSAARCAAVSFRNEDYTLEKSLQVCERLTGDDRKHGSAFEHQGSPMQRERKRWTEEFGDVLNTKEFPSTWEAGISHVDRDGHLWSGNFKGFLQYRKLIPGENYTGEASPQRSKEVC